MTSFIACLHRLRLPPSAQTPDNPTHMARPKQWWRRAAAVAKDKKALYLVTVARFHRGGNPQRQEVQAAVIRATNHDDRSIDYKSAGRVFAWARTAPVSFLQPLMWAISGRAQRTHSWAVALKSLLLAHGLLLCSDEASPVARLGRLPFDLSGFSDRSVSSGFSAFVRSYFRFLDHRSILKGDRDESEVDADLAELERLQTLLELLMQIQPYADGMEEALILEAMNCVVIDIFEVYSNICNGISRFLIRVRSPNSSKSRGNQAMEARNRRGEIGMRVLRRSTAQSALLAAYFELCRFLGILNPADIPTIRTIPEEDMANLERLLIHKSPSGEEEKEEIEEGVRSEREEDSESGANSGNEEKQGLCCKDSCPWTPWAQTVNGGRGNTALGDMIELM